MDSKDGCTLEHIEIVTFWVGGLKKDFSGKTEHFFYFSPEFPNDFESENLKIYVSSNFCSFLAS